MYCWIWDWCIVGLVQQVYRRGNINHINLKHTRGKWKSYMIIYNVGIIRTLTSLVMTSQINGKFTVVYWFIAPIFFNSNLFMTPTVFVPCYRAYIAMDHHWRPVRVVPHTENIELDHTLWYSRFLFGDVSQPTISIHLFEWTFLFNIVISTQPRTVCLVVWKSRGFGNMNW